jgi:hypothetical protein
MSVRVEPTPEHFQPTPPPSSVNPSSSVSLINNHLARTPTQEQQPPVETQIFTVKKISVHFFAEKIQQI